MCATSYEQHTASASGFTPFSIMEMQMDSVRRSRWQFCVAGQWAGTRGEGEACEDYEMLVVTDQDGRNLVQDINGLLGSSLFFGPLVGRHLGAHGMPL
jgi:hypothetical protein